MGKACSVLPPVACVYQDEALLSLSSYNLFFMCHQRRRANLETETEERASTPAKTYEASLQSFPDHKQPTVKAAVVTARARS